jgi:hypothetical protein
MKRSLNVSARVQSSLMIGLVMLGASLNGCGPGETPSPGSGGTPAAPAASATTAGPGQKAGRQQVDSTSRRDLHKQRAEERAKAN